MIGSRVITTYITTTEELHELAEWLDQKATEISTKFATGDFA